MIKRICLRTVIAAKARTCPHRQLNEPYGETQPVRGFLFLARHVDRSSWRGHLRIGTVPEARKLITTAAPVCAEKATVTNTSRPTDSLSYRR